MGFRRCPGSVAFSQPTIELVRCQQCGQDAEVWSDEAEGTCPGCGKDVVRTNKQSCVDWCKYARECLGDEKYRKYQDTKSAMRKEALVRAATDRFGWEESRAARARDALQYAEEILKQQPDTDPNVVMAAAVLGVADGEGGELQVVLEDLNYPKGFIKQVDGILKSLSAGPFDDMDTCATHDALLLASQSGDSEGAAPEGASSTGVAAFLTAAGRRIKLAEQHGRSAEAS